MKGKLLVLAGAAAGYVLGTRAGRERYEQIKARVSSMWHDPAVQQKVTEAQEAVKEKAPEVQERLSDAASQAAEKARSVIRRNGDDGEATGDDRLGQVRQAE